MEPLIQKLGITKEEAKKLSIDKKCLGNSDEYSDHYDVYQDFQHYDTYPDCYTDFTRHADEKSQ